MTEVEDFKAATTRLLSKLPRVEAIAKRDGMSSPRLEIEAGDLRFVAFAAVPEDLSFLGVPQSLGETSAGRWREFTIDADGHLLDGARKLRIRRIDWEEARPGETVKSWPDFTKARKVRPQG